MLHTKIMILKAIIFISSFFSLCIPFKPAAPAANSVIFQPLRCCYESESNEANNVYYAWNNTFAIHRLDLQRNQMHKHLHEEKNTHKTKNNSTNKECVHIFGQLKTITTTTIYHEGPPKQMANRLFARFFAQSVYNFLCTWYLDELQT